MTLPQVIAAGVTPRAVTITLPGGTLPVGRFSATIHYKNSPKVTRGMNVIALLQNREGKYIPAAGAGVFEVSQGRIVALCTRAGAHQQFSRMVADNFVSQIVTKLKNVQRNELRLLRSPAQKPKHHRSRIATLGPPRGDRG